MVDLMLKWVLLCAPGPQHSLGTLFMRGRGLFTYLLLGGLLCLV